jgi:Na+-driven multidrug efflux pump
MANLFLLPRIGPIGSAIALIANDLLGFALTLVILKKRMKRND